MCFARLAVPMVFIGGLLVLFSGPPANELPAQAKEPSPGLTVSIAGSVNVERLRGLAEEKVTLEGKGFKAVWHEGGADVRNPPHWHVAFEKPFGETPVVVATPVDTSFDDVFAVTLFRIDREGFRVKTDAKRGAFGFTFVVVVQR
ncbi:MAG: hypothetical protein U0793_14310 [Gemmataceae bacterium]